MEVARYYEQEQVLLYNPRKAPIHKATKPLHKIPFSLHDHLPVISLKIDGKTYKFGLDTGAGANVLDPKLKEMLLEKGASRGPIAEMQGMDRSIVQVETIKVPELELSGGSIKDVKFLLNDLSHLGGKTGIHIDGLLGYPFLSKMKFSINYQKQKIYVWSIE